MAGKWVEHHGNVVSYSWHVKQCEGPRGPRRSIGSRLFALDPGQGRNSMSANGIGIKGEAWLVIFTITKSTA